MSALQPISSSSDSDSMHELNQFLLQMCSSGISRDNISQLQVRFKGIYYLALPENYRMVLNMALSMAVQRNNLSEQERENFFKILQKKQS